MSASLKTKTTAPTRREAARLAQRRTRLLAMALIGAGLLVFAAISAVLLLNNLPAPGSASQNQSAGLLVPAEVSFPAPDLSLTDLNGSSVALADFAGQVVLINNWATWCPPCKAEMPTLHEYYQKYQAQGFTIVAISAGDASADVRIFVDTLGLTFPVWLDPNTQAMQAFRNDGLPSSYVMDRSGKIVLAWTGAVDLETLEQYVTPLIVQ